MNRLLANAVVDEETGRALEYCHLIHDPKYQKEWATSCTNEFGQLAQGVGKQMPIDPPKAEKNRTRITEEGNLIEYHGEVHTPMADIEVAKLLFNSVISTPKTCLFTLDIKDFHLNTPTKKYEYVKITYHLIPNEIKEQYNLELLVQDNDIYIKVRKDMYGMPQAGNIAHDELKLNLAKFGYEAVTPLGTENINI
eukprot:12962258-Ditylum_brightwellii.AAC.2